MKVQVNLYPDWYGIGNREVEISADAQREGVRVIATLDSVVDGMMNPHFFSEDILVTWDEIEASDKAVHRAAMELAGRVVESAHRAACELGAFRMIDDSEAQKREAFVAHALEIAKGMVEVVDRGQHQSIRFVGQDTLLWSSADKELMKHRHASMIDVLVMAMLTGWDARQN